MRNSDLAEDHLVFIHERTQFIVSARCYCALGLHANASGLFGKALKKRFISILELLDACHHVTSRMPDPRACNDKGKPAFCLYLLEAFSLAVVHQAAKRAHVAVRPGRILVDKPL